MKISHSSIPGPTNRILGLEHLPRLARDLLNYTCELSNRYGDIAEVRIASARMVVLRHPDHLHDVLVEHSNSFVREPRMLSIFGPWLGKGILLSDGDQWRRQRPAVQHAWQLHNTQRAIDAARHHTQRLLLNRMGEQFDFAEATEKLAFSVMLELITGIRDTEQTERYFRAASVLQDFGINRMTDLRPLPRWLPTPQHRRYYRALDEIIALLDQTIESSQPGDETLVGRLRAAEQAGQLQPLEVRHALANLLFGGKETAGSSLLFTLYLLAQHPEHQAQAALQAHAELQGGAIQVDDLPRLPLLQQIYLESQRLYPAVPTLSRMAAETVELGGYKIRKGSHLMLSVWSMHRDPRWFEEPERFEPERFQPERQRQMRPHSYLPFGAGIHICIGRHLGVQEAVTMLATLLPAAKVELPSDHQPPRLIADMRLHPAGPVELKLVPRVPLLQTHIERPASNQASKPA